MPGVFRVFLQHHHVLNNTQYQDVDFNDTLTATDPAQCRRQTNMMHVIHRTNMWRCSKLLKVSCELMACRSLVCGMCFQSICLDGWVSQRVGRLRNMMLQHVALVHTHNAGWIRPRHIPKVIAHRFRLMIKIRQNQKTHGDITCWIGHWWTINASQSRSMLLCSFFVMNSMDFINFDWNRPTTAATL